MSDFIHMPFVQSHLPELLTKFKEQIYLVSLSSCIAILLGMPLGVFGAQSKRLKTFFLSATAIIWTIPSLALLAFLVPCLGIGMLPAIIVLTLYALLPIIRGTITGLEGVPHESIEAACGLGFTRFQRLRLVELPLALPVIINGVRTAVVMGTSIATLAAFIGAGGLGDFINQGLAMNQPKLILLGAIPVTVLALTLDALIARFEKHCQRREQSLLKDPVLIMAFTVLLVFPLSMMVNHYFSINKNTIVIASKRLTEQYILAEMMADLIKTKTKLPVKIKHHMGTTAIIHSAMLKNEIDIYPEYTGVAYLTILKKPSTRKSHSALYHYVKKAYEKQYHVTWLAPLGFENSQAIYVRPELAKQYHLHRISDLRRLAPHLTFGGFAEAIVRPDALPALAEKYHIHFGHVKALEIGLMFEAIENHQVDVILADTTDGRVQKAACKASASSRSATSSCYSLVKLIDNRHVFPHYDAAPVVCEAILEAHPEIKKALRPLAHLINEKTMQHLNYLVDVEHQAPAVVARQFLKMHHLV